jgi:2-dehydro-3-deoxygluconokinase
MSYTVTFGEVMTRFRTPDFKRISQAMPGGLEVSFAGAEANVAASLALLGGSARFVTALPDNPIADACIAFLQGFGIDTSAIIRIPGGRIGTYYLEVGANQRGSAVIYDRDHSAVGLTPYSAYSWDKIFEEATRFHVTGITPAISAEAAEAALRAVTEARKRGITVSCDLNFRSKLWRWEAGTAPKELARRVMGQIMEHVNLVIANEGDAADVLDIHAGSSNVEAGSLEIASYPAVAQTIVSRYPAVEMVAITLRESVSASHNRWGAMLYTADDQQARFAPEREGTYRPYEITHIVDRVGAGDSFGAGLMFALDDPAYHNDPAGALSFAVAASALCHSVEGDFNLVSRQEVETLARGNAAGRVQR